MRRNLRVAGVYLASVFAAGLLGVWPVIQHQFQDAGVFANLCTGADDQNVMGKNRSTHSSRSSGCDEQNAALSNVYMLGSNLIFTLSWPVCLAFDLLGPRMAVSSGALMYWPPLTNVY